MDLHRGFHNVADWPGWWDLLSRHREVHVIEGQPVAIPDRIGCALIAGLHASQATLLRKPLEDLQRALELFDDEVWRRAADLAGSVGAGAAFAAGLHRQNAGADLAARLGLTVTDRVTWFRATAVTRGTGSLNIVLEPGTWAERAQRLWDVTFPSRTGLARSLPIAARGPAGLAIARLGRLWVIGTRLPRLLLAWHRTSRELRRFGDSASRPATPARAGPTQRARAEAVAATTWWTLRTWWRVHQRLARGPWAAAALPATTAPTGTMPPHPGRAARLVLACCRATCLETALVRQAHAAGAGVAIDVIIGVTAPATGLRAHAWLDGDRVDPGFVELCRFPAVTPRPDLLRRGA